MTTLIANSQHMPFYVAAGTLAAWAIVIGAIGIRSHNFPGSGGGFKIVAGLTVVLVAATIGTAIGTAERPEGEHPRPKNTTMGVVPQPDEQDSAQPAAKP